MPNILLGVTGSVAAIRTPAIFAALRARGFSVKIVATRAAAYFFNPAHIEPLDAARRNPDIVILDDDEWPQQREDDRYSRGDSVLHIELRRWADLFLIAPLDANTLGKLANGLCDNCLTCVWRAWDQTRSMVLAPAMNALMWHHPMTRRHLRQIAANAGAEHIPENFDESQIIDLINDRSPTLRIIPPRIKELACGDIGIGAMSEIDDIVAVVMKRVSIRSVAFSV